MDEIKKIPRIIAVDPGKFATKAAANRSDVVERFLTFRTKMEETLRTEAQGKSYVVQYEGKRYLLGEQAEVASAKSTKAEEIHRIATYTALHQLANGEDSIVVGVGVRFPFMKMQLRRKPTRNFCFRADRLKLK